MQTVANGSGGGIFIYIPLNPQGQNALWGRARGGGLSARSITNW